jgi:RNA polymerase sigma-70 factor (sigma-E family)
MDARAQEEFGQFMAGRWPGLVRLAYGLTGDRWLAEDIAQTALATAYAAWWRVSRADDPDAYVRRILINTSNRRFRRRRVTGNPHELAELPDAWTADPADRVGDRAVLLAAVRELPPRQRAIVVLRYWEDLSDAQVAAVLGCSAGTVRSQASRALAKLRVSAALADGDDSAGQPSAGQPSAGQPGQPARRVPDGPPVRWQDEAAGADRHWRAEIPRAGARERGHGGRADRVRHPGARIRHCDVGVRRQVTRPAIRPDGGQEAGRAPVANPPSDPAWLIRPGGCGVQWQMRAKIRSAILAVRALWSAV